MHALIREGSLTRAKTHWHNHHYLFPKGMDIPILEPNLWTKAIYVRFVIIRNWYHRFNMRNKLFACNACQSKYKCTIAICENICMWSLAQMTCSCVMNIQVSMHLINITWRQYIKFICTHTIYYVIIMVMSI